MKKNNKKYLLSRLFKYLYQYKWLLFIALVLTIISNLLALLGPKLSGYAIDAIEPGKGSVIFEKVFYYAGFMILFYFLSAFLNYILSIIMVRFSRKVVYQMRKDAFDKITSLPVSFFDKHQAGDIISIISYDIDTINTSLSTDLLQIVTSIITVAGSLFMMLSIAPLLVSVFAITIPVSILLTRYMTKKVRPLFRKRSATLGELNGFVEEVTGGLKTTKAYHGEEDIIRRFDLKNEKAVEAYFNADYFGSMMGPSVNFVNNLSLTLISVFGIFLFMKNLLTLGEISSFVLYSRKFSGPINEFANIMSELQSAFAAAERVFKLLDEPIEPVDSNSAIELTQVDGSMKAENISFCYLPKKPILTNFSLEANKGNIIAIVGPTGAGKTTIINLLMRFYDIDSGTIYLDGTDIRQITRKSLRLGYTMVLQDTWLFYGTIYENIAYGKENVTLDDVIAVAKAAKIHNYIMSLPDGYNTILSDNGSNISKGQKQQLTIARAMLLDSNMLILDEATSNVDTQTERFIQSAMLHLMKNKTCFVIAHRLSTIENADCILVLNHGDVIEQGTHNELINKDSFYKELYYAQFM